MKRAQKLLVLAVVLAAVVGLYFLTSSAVKKSEAEAAEETDAAMTDLSVGAYEDVNALTWTYLDATVSLKLEEGRWVCASDESCPIDPDKADAMRTTAAAITGELCVESSEDYGAYGLEDPEIVLVVGTADAERTYEIGNVNDLTGAYYMRVDGGDAVYLEDGSIEASFWYDLYNLVEMESAPANVAQVTGFDIASDALNATLLYTDGPLAYSYTDAYNWFLSDGQGTYIALDSAAVEALYGGLTGIAWQSCVSWNADAAALAQYGLTEPQGVVTLHYADSEGFEQSFSVEFGAYSGSNVYARIAGSRMVYLVSGTVLDGFMYADTESLLPTDVCPLEPEDLSAALLTQNGESRALDLDDETVSGWLADAMGLSSDGSAAGAEGREELLALTLTLTDGTDLVLRFASYNSADCLASFDGEPSKLVSRTSVEALLEGAATLLTPSESPKGE